MAQGLDSMSTNYISYTSSNRMRTCVTPQSTYKALNLRHQCIILIADKTHTLHNKLRSCNINTVGKRKQIYVLTAGLVSIRHNTWIIREY